MRWFRKRWAVVCALVVTLVGAELGVRWMGRALPDPSPLPSLESRVKVTLLAEVTNPIDVVLLGDSVMEGGVDPARLESRFGVEAFNAAVPFSTPLAMEPWVDVVLSRLHPRVVVIGLGFDPAQTTDEDDPLRQALEETPDRGVWALAGRVSDLIRRRRQLREWSATLRDIRAVRAGTWTKRGFQTGYVEGTIRSVATVKDPARASEEVMTPDNAAALARLIRRLEGQGVAVIIVMEPIRCGTEACRQAVAMSPYHRQVLEIGEALGVTVFDTNAERWDPTMFVDALHLTGAGVGRFTDAVGRLVATAVRA